MSVPEIFVSSTFADFTKERAILKQVSGCFDAAITLAENKGDQGADITSILRRWIDKSDLIILLIGARYGSESESGYSWTEEEFRYAIRQGKEVKAYHRLLPVKQQAALDRDPRKAQKLRSFMSLVEGELGNIPRFKSTETCKLVAWVSQAITKVCLEHEIAQQVEDYQDGFSWS